MLHQILVTLDVDVEKLFKYCACVLVLYNDQQTS